jgi:hypothetical protein
MKSPSLLNRPARACLHWLPVGAVLAGVVVFFLAGCAVPEGLELPRTPVPVYAPVNHVGVGVLPPDLRRVVLLPVCGGGLVDGEVAASLDPIFLAGLQKQMRFEVVPVSREWCRRYFGASEFSSSGALPHDFLARLARDVAVDGVMFLDLTAYRDHRPLGLGLRAKLAVAKDSQLLWGFDEILSVADPAVAAGAREFVRAANPPGQPVDLSPSALQSPSRFAAYVAATAFGTLPPR